MQGIKIEFDWATFADYVVEERPGKPGTLLSEMPTVQLVALGDPLMTRPLDKFPDLYLELAKSEPTIAGQKKFAKKYGLLTDRYREHTSAWPGLVENMRNLVERAGNLANWDIRDEKYVRYDLPRSFTLRFGPTGGETNEMALSIVPNNLYNALFLQCVSNRAGGAKVRSCKACGELFEIGGMSGRRSHREFCSDKCRFDFSHRNRRGKL